MVLVVEVQAVLSLRRGLLSVLDQPVVNRSFRVSSAVHVCVGGLTMMSRATQCRGGRQNQTNPLARLQFKDEHVSSFINKHIGSKRVWDTFACMLSVVKIDGEVYIHCV